MRVFNLTDVPTSELLAASMANISISVDGVVIKPGDSAEVKRVAHGELQRYFAIDALAMGQPHQRYLAAKAALATTVDAPVAVLPIPEAVEDEPEARDRFNKKK